MNDLYFKTVLAGVFFALWPIFMNRSGLKGSVSAAAFCLFALVIVLPFALKGINISSLVDANWKMAVAAGFIAGLGLLAFNDVLAKVTPERLSELFVMMIVVQIAVPALYQVIITRSMTVSTGTGFVFAVVAAILLTR